MDKPTQTFVKTMCGFAAITAFCLFMVLPKDTSGSVVKNRMTSLTDAQLERVRSFADEWNTQPAFDYSMNALDPSFSVSAVANSLFDPTDDYWGLPKDEAGTYELVDAFCSGCHSMSIVMQQRATPERWQELLIWMEKKQGMAPLPDEFEPLILEYLSTHFSTQ